MECPEYPVPEKRPLLDFNGTGKAKKVSATHWLVTDKQVREVLRFEKACYENEAEHLGTAEAINTYNRELNNNN